VQWLPGLDQDVRSPIFNVKRPEDKTDEEIVAHVEKKVIQMIGNFTHKEWECAQRILKHQGRVNRVFDEMGVTYSLRPVPPTASKKMRPLGNTGSEPVETSRKGKSGKPAVMIEGAPKSTKAQDILAKRKADAAKATLPPLAEKSSKLLKINENLARRKTEAAKVAAAEREKKKVHESSPAVDLEKKVVSKKRPASASEKEKRVVVKEKGPDDDEPVGKKARANPIAETDKDVDILSAPQIQPCTSYPPKGTARKAVEELPSGALADPEELEARDARSKCVAEMVQKQIAMANTTSKERVDGLVDVVDETEELCYIDDDVPSAAKDQEIFALEPRADPKETTMRSSENLELQAQDPINLDPPEIEKSVANASRSPPPVLDDINQAAAKAAGETAPLLATETNVLQLEDARALFKLVDDFSCPPYGTSFLSTNNFRFCVVLATKTFVTLISKEKESLKIKVGPSASGVGVDSMLLEPGTISHRLIRL
jgi:hypothetical protein